MSRQFYFEHLLFPVPMVKYTIFSLPIKLLGGRKKRLVPYFPLVWSKIKYLLKCAAQFDLTVARKRTNCACKPLSAPLFCIAKLFAMRTKTQSRQDCISVLQLQSSSSSSGYPTTSKRSRKVSSSKSCFSGFQAF